MKEKEVQHVFIYVVLAIILGFFVCELVNMERMEDRIKRGYFTHNGVNYVITKK